LDGITEYSSGYIYSRKISNRPYKIIEAPGLMDDFYLNLLDWSSKNDLVAGQGSSVYLWCANKTQCLKLLNYEGEKYVSSVIWNSDGTEVAVGNSEGVVEIWDSKK
jgi:cell division cycle 20-like protein 1 (cofactor of APC complex)